MKISTNKQQKKEDILLISFFATLYYIVLKNSCYYYKEEKQQQRKQDLFLCSLLLSLTSCLLYEPMKFISTNSKRLVFNCSNNKMKRRNIPPVQSLWEKYKNFIQFAL